MSSSPVHNQNAEQIIHHPNLTSSKTGTFYFAYGSNLSAHQMSLRLPHDKSSSVPIAIARLESYTWIICKRGYANVVALPPSNTSSDVNTLWGVLYNMSAEDEVVLDRYEGHNSARNAHPKTNPDPSDQQRKPYLQGGWDYNKLYLPVTVTKWLQNPEQFGIKVQPQTLSLLEKTMDDNSQNSTKMNHPTTVRVLIYVDEKRVEPGTISTEYIGRMNRGIDEATKLGLPEEWVDKVMRKWIPKGIFVDDQGYVGTDKGYVTTESGQVMEALATETGRPNTQRASATPSVSGSEFEPEREEDKQKRKRTRDQESKLTEHELIKIRSGEN